MAVDFTISRAHQHAASTRKGARRRGTSWKIWHALRLARRWGARAAD